MLAAMIPDEYLRREFEKSLTAEELEKIKSLGGLEKLIDEFKRQVEDAARGEGKDKSKEGRVETARAMTAKTATARSAEASVTGINATIRPTMTTSSWVRVA